MAGVLDYARTCPWRDKHFFPCVRRLFAGKQHGKFKHLSFLKCHEAIEKSNKALCCQNVESFFLFVQFACFAFVYTLALCARLKILRIRFSDSKNSDRSLTDECLLEAVLLPLTEAKSLCPSLVLFFNQKSFLFLLVQQKRQARL